MKVDIISEKSRKPLELNEEIFGVPYNEGLIHQVVTAYMAGSRAGTRAQKTRGEVSGGGIKPWKQKGTGRARAGSIRSPIWRKGGTTFAAKPQDHSQKINRKMYRGALRSIVAELLRTDRMKVVENIPFSDSKTKSMVEWTKQLGVKDVLVVAMNPADEVVLAARNLPFIDVIDVTMVDPVSLIGFANVIITHDALRKLEESLA
jgi:large subunit ribosomal protein L4